MGGRHDTRTTPGNETRDSRPLQGAPSPKPLHQHPSQVPPAAQVGGGTPTTIGTLERTTGAAWHRPPVSSGGRRVTTGATGGTTTKRKTDGEEARGGERDARAGKVAKYMERGRGYLGGGREGGPEPSVEK